ncbi:MAG: SDR family oxidoreductase [Desulfuromonadales bacterium]|nr:SDR family oxidoreductase [Desulfuromonadales bacterium]
MDNVFIAGCGYIGERVARLVRDLGSSVACMTRSAERALHLTGEGFEAMNCSLDDAAQLPTLDVSGRVVFYFVPPPGGGISDQRARNFCAAMNNSAHPSKIIYISATSVYGVKDGSVVTEQSATDPTSAMGKRRLDAEKIFRNYGAEHSVPVIILRVSGIYGPGRLPLTQIHQGQPLLRLEESGPSNRIHADDLARICVATAEKGEDGDIFNVSDGQPSSMTEYFNAVADALGAPRQPQVSLEEAHRVMSPLMLSYVSEARVVDPTHMFKRLGITLRYATLRDGLLASIPQINK